jgi:hypothetical protein
MNRETVDVQCCSPRTADADGVDSQGDWATPWQARGVCGAFKLASTLAKE